MNVQRMELSHLITLWEASNENQELKQKLEIELQNRIRNNTNFSREYIFNVCKIKNHAISVSFIPTSKSYELYGPNLTIDIILNDEEFEELTKNIITNPPINTTGIIKAKILVKDSLTNEQIETAAKTGFHTRDIFETSHL